MIHVYDKDTAPEVYKGVTILAIARVAGHRIILYQSGSCFIVENVVAGNRVGIVEDIREVIDSNGYSCPVWIYSKLEAMQIFRRCVAAAKAWEENDMLWEKTFFPFHHVL